MKVGMIPQLTSFNGKPDFQTYQEELALADMAEDMGFDSIWALDHHFTGYTMSPDPTQMLTYFAGRTKRVQLGTAVIVLPWHDPVEVAEKIALLDVLSNGRTIIGFGRGAATVEYEGYRIPMHESRERFVECAEIVRKGLTQDSFSYDGKYYQIPEIQIRPRPISHPEQRFYASSVSPESAEIMAKLGLGVLIIAQRSWEDTATDYQRYVENALASGFQPRPPIGCSTCWCRTMPRRPKTWPRCTWAPCLTPSKTTTVSPRAGLNEVKGYEFYGKMAKTYAKLNADEEAKAKAVEFYRSLHAAGTAEQVLEKFRYVHSTVALEHVVNTFGFGGIPIDKLRRSYQLFAERILPVLQHDAAFKLPKIRTATPRWPPRPSPSRIC